MFSSEAIYMILLIDPPRGSLAVLCLLALAACGGGGGGAVTTSTTSTTPPTASAASVLCSYSDSATQNLVYTQSAPGRAPTLVNETLPSSYAWTCDSSRKLSANSVPNHAVTNGNFATKIAAQTVSVSFALAPTAGSTATNARISGYALNGVKFDPNTAGTCASTATVSGSTISGCNYAAGTDPWRMEALAGSVTPWRFDFGVDASNAHVQPTGEYHYHGMPEGLLGKLGAANTKMTLVGWAIDGFPIYARYGYTVASDKTSALKKLSTSYRTKATPDTGRPSTTAFPMGHFQQDWEYVAGLGDLDECNGRVGVTPEFPNGTYHYFITDSYPFIQRCTKGR
jgi:hypothetical protein